MKIRLLSILLGLLTILSTLASNKPTPVYSVGTITLNNGTQLNGELNYNWKAEIVQLHVNGTVKAYSAHQINNFAYFDNQTNSLRQFSAVDYPMRKGFIRPIFMEEFSRGTLTVYRRLRHAREPFKLDKPAAYGSNSQITQDYDNFTYLVYHDEQFTDMDTFTRDIWPQMEREFGQELKQYAAVRQLDHTSTPARLMLINQYNYLKAEADAGRSPSTGVGE